MEIILSSSNQVELLNSVLSNTYAIYLKSQNYHWHVKGTYFHSMHKMLEEHYNDLAEAVDEIAERIVILGGNALATFSELNSHKTVSDGNSNADAVSMIKDLVESHKEVIKSIKVALKSSQNNEDEVSIGLLIDRIGWHEKIIWMLEAHTK